MRGAVPALLLCLLISARAEPRLVLVLVHEGLTPEQLSGDIPHQSAWMLWKRVPAVPDTAEPWLMGRALVFATGRRLPADASDGVVLMDNAPFERGTAWQAFRRRTGTTPPRPALLALNAGGLSRREVLQHTMGARLQRAGLTGLYLVTPESPPPSPYALIGVNRDGYMPVRAFPDFESMRVALPALDADWVLIEMARWDYAALELLMAEGIETWVVSLQPPDGGLDGVARLTAIVRYAAREPTGLLTSASTRWTGLIIEADLVPTLTRAIGGESVNWREADGVPAFNASESDWHAFWNGQLLRTGTRALRQTMGLSDRRDMLTRIEEHWRIQHELAPVLLIVVAAIGTVWVLGGLGLWWLQRLGGWLRSFYRVGLAVLLLFPAVAIWYSYCPFELWTGDRAGDASVLVGWLVAGWVVLSLVMAALIHRLEMPPLSAAGAVVLLVILLDIYFAGGYGVNRSLMGLYLWEGARLYGLDNTYLGIVLPLALLAPASWLESVGRHRPGGRGLMALTAFYALLILTFGLPMLGSNLGAWAPMALAFGWMLNALLPEHVSASWRTPLPGRWLLPALLALAFIAMMLVVWLDSRQHWRLQSHFGRAWQSMLAGDFGMLIGAKLTVAQRVMFSLPMIAAVVGFGLLALAVWQWLRLPLVRLWHGINALRSAIYACGVGAIAAVLFNDSGLVTAALIAGGVVLWLLDALVSQVEWVQLPTNGHRRGF